MLERVKDLNSIITADTLSIVWITSEGLDKSPSFFEELNYHLDGLLDHAPAAHEKTSGKHLFVSTQFAHPFFVAHLKLNIATLKKEISDIIEMIKIKRTIEVNRIVFLLSLPETDLLDVQKLISSLNLNEFKLETLRS